MATTTEFRISGITATVMPAQPPITAWPTVVASPIVRYPEPTRSNGYNQPAGIIGLPYCEFGRDKIRQVGIDYYSALFSSATAEYTRVKVRLYDIRSASWKVYTGTLWRPRVKDSVPGSAYTFRDFRAAIVDLVEIANWAVVST